MSAQVRFDIPPVLQGDKAGYQDLVGELLTSGTSRRTKQQIDELVDGLGAQLAGSSDGVYASALKKNFPQVMELVFEVVTSATYPPAEFDKAKTNMLSGIRTRADDPDQIAEVMDALNIMNPNDTPEERRFYSELFNTGLHLLGRPVHQDEFDFGDKTYIKEIFDEGMRISKLKKLGKLRTVRGTRHGIYINRAYFGVYMLLHKLGAKVRTKSGWLKKE